MVYGKETFLERRGQQRRLHGNGNDAEYGGAALAAMETITSTGPPGLSRSEMGAVDYLLRGSGLAPVSPV